MNLMERINLAVVYVLDNGINDDVKNDAANIFSESYDEYILIYEALLNI